MPEVRDDQLPKNAGLAETDMTPLRAASVILLRGEPYEVLLLRRHAGSSFVPGSWVFPGGAVDDVDRLVAERTELADELSLLKISAYRELFEESGVWLGDPLSNPERSRTELLADPAAFAVLSAESGLDLDRLVWTSRWITPKGIPKRYDTWFFLAVIDEWVHASPEYQEAVEALWVTPDEALRRHDAGELPLVFPTIRNLSAIRGFESSGALLESRRRAKIETTRPVLELSGGRKRIVVPGDA